MSRKRDAVAVGVDVERLVGRGAPVRVAEVPVAADVVAGLEAGVGQAAVAQRLAGGEAADAGADDAGRGLSAMVQCMRTGRRARQFRDLLKLSPYSSRNCWTSALRRKSSPVQIRTPIAIRITPADRHDHRVVALDDVERGRHPGEGERRSAGTGSRAQPSRRRAGSAPCATESDSAAAERIAARVGPTQGVQAIAKAAPATTGPPLPARSISASTCHSRLSRGMNERGDEQDPHGDDQAAEIFSSGSLVVLEGAADARSRSARAG